MSFTMSMVIDGKAHGPECDKTMYGSLAAANVLCTCDPPSAKQQVAMLKTTGTISCTLAPGPIGRQIRVESGRGQTPVGRLATPDPLDAVIDGITLRTLLECDQQAQREGAHTWQAGSRRLFTPAQRNRVSCYWSAQLRAKVAASTAARKAREPSVVVDLEDW